MFQSFIAVLVNLLGGYIAKLASKEFAEWALFRIAEAIVASTKTKEDNAWLEQIKKTVTK